MRLPLRLSLALLALAIAIAPALADQPTTFIRFTNGEQPRTGALEIAQATYRWDKSQVEVILYGVVHMADAAYYKQVQKDLDSYDVVLYEGVKPPKDAKPDAGMQGLGELQKTMGEMLGLQFQKDGINYQAKNLVHADMTYDELAKASGGDPSKALPLGGMFNADMLKVIAPMLKMGGQFLKGMFESNPQMREGMKLQLAQQLQRAPEMIQGEMQRVIVVERNKVAIKVLEQELAKRTTGRIAIFYGAAHNKDFHERLLALGFKQTNKEWKSAWTIGNFAPTKAAPTPAPAKPRADEKVQKETYY